MTVDRVAVWVQDLVGGVPDWAAGTWNVQRRLIPDSSTDTEGSRGPASFKMLRRARNDGYGDTVETFVPQRGQYIIIADIGGATPFDRTIHWAGQIVGVHKQPLRGSTDDVGSVDAIGIGSVLDQTPVAGLKQRNPAGSSALTLLTNPTANLAGANGQVIGNCYTGATPNLFESLPDNIGAGTNVAYWSRWALLVHVTTYAPTGTKVPTLSLSSGSAMATYLQTVEPEVFELDTLSIGAFIDLMVGPASGGTWNVSPTKSGWTIAMDSASDVGVGGFPAGTIVAATVNGNDVDVSLDQSGPDVPDAVEVVGAPIVYCGTVSPIDGSLGQGWSAAQQTAYLAGASATPGYGGFATDKKRQFNRNVRRSALLQDTFARFELRRNTPTADLQCSTVTTAGAPPAAASTQPLCPAITWDGISAGAYVNTSNAASPYLPAARVLNFLPIPLNSTTAADSAKAQPTYMQPLVYRYVASGSAYDAWPLWADLLHPPSMKWPTPNVQTDDRGPAIRIEYDHPEMLGRADWTGSPAITEQDPTLTTAYGATDWRNLVLTVAVEGDQRVKARVLRSGVTTPRSTLRIYRKDLHCWLVRSGTITGLDGTGAIHYGVDTFTRDDHPVAQRLAEQAAGFALRTRTGATITLTDPANPPSWAAVGTLIGTLSETDANGIVLATRTLNTVVRSVRRVWDPKQPRLVVVLDYPTLPTGGMAGAQTSVSLGGSVQGSLQRTQADVGDIARSAQRPLLSAARQGQADAVAKTFTVAKTAHGWVVGKWIGWDTGTSAWVTASRTGTYENLAIVTEVVDADNVTVAHGSGLVYLPTLTYTNYTPYYLNTSGDGSGPIRQSAGKTAPVVDRLLFWSIESHWIWLAGSELRDGHNHHIGDGADVKISAPANNDLLQYDLASTLWKNVTPASVLSTALGTGAAISVYGRSANSAGVRADIAASTTGDVLQMGASSLSWGQLQTASYADLSVTTAKLSAIISAGSAGSASAIPVLAWGVDGRLTSVSTATPLLSTLGDVTITSVANRDFLRYNGTAWVNTNLGEVAWVNASREFALDGGTGASASSVVGIGKTGSRFMVGGSGTSLDFLISGLVSAGTDKVARLAFASSEVGFWDTASASQGTGTKVISWLNNVTAASREFRLIDLPFTLHGGYGMQLRTYGPIWWSPSGGAAYSDKTCTAQYVSVIGATTAWLLNMPGSAAQNAGLAVNVNTTTDVITVSMYGDLSSTGGAAFNGASSTLSSAGNVSIAGAAKTLGFFASAGTTRTAVAAPAAITTTNTAGASYTANEQTMLGQLKTDVTNLRTTLNNLRFALNGYNLV